MLTTQKKQCLSAVILCQPLWPARKFAALLKKNGVWDDCWRWRSAVINRHEFLSLASIKLLEASYRGHFARLNGSCNWYRLGHIRGHQTNCVRHVCVKINNFVTKPLVFLWNSVFVGIEQLHQMLRGESDFDKTPTSNITRLCLPNEEISHARATCDPRGHFVRPAMLFRNFEIINKLFSSSPVQVLDERVSRFLLNERRDGQRWFAYNSRYFSQEIRCKIYF